MTTQTPPLSSTQISDAQAQANAIANTITSNVVGSNTFVFFAAFDGTNNGADPVSDGSGNKQTTAVRQLFLQVTRSGSTGGTYKAGVGVPGTLPLSEAWNSTVTEQSRRNAEAAYSEFVEQAEAWHLAHPTDSFTSMITSFSRGGAAAAIFAQILYERGLVFTDKTTGAQTILIPPGSTSAVSAALIIDPVLSNVNGNMQFPPNVQHLTVVRAQNEYRNLFPAANYTGDNATIREVTGNHGDAGDFYDNGLGGMYLGAYTSYFQHAGLNIGNVPTDRQYTTGTSVVVHSEGLDPAPGFPISGWWDATYNHEDITNPAYLTVARDVAPFGTNGSPASGSSFVEYDNSVVLNGSGGSYSTNGQKVFVLAGSHDISLEGSLDVVTIKSGASLTFTDAANSLSNAFILEQNASLIMDPGIQTTH